MRITKLNQSIDLSYGDSVDDPKFTLKNDIEYVLTDYLVSVIIKKGFGHIIKSDINFYNDTRVKQRIYAGQNLYGRKLITFRNGGVGDLIFQLPSIKELKDTYKDNIRITICCNEQYLDIFGNLSYIDKTLALPLELGVLLENDYFVNFESLIELNERAESVNAYDLHAEKFFIKPKIMTPKLESFPEKDKMVLKEIDINKKNIVIALQASAPIRSVNLDLWANLIANVGLNHKNVKFYICGTKSQVKIIDTLIKSVQEQAKVFNCINWSKKHSDLGSVISLIKFSDCVIGPDSGLLHIAGGFETPIIGIYGPFHSKLRLQYYKNAIGLDSMTNCSFAERNQFKSCFQHGHEPCKAAVKNGEQISPCLNIFSPLDIIKEMKVLNLI